MHFCSFFRLALPPKSDTREELTALKALDKLLRTYDRRSTPTNDLGKQLFTYVRGTISMGWMGLVAPINFQTRKSLGVKIHPQVLNFENYLIKENLLFHYLVLHITL